MLGCGHPLFLFPGLVRFLRIPYEIKPEIFDEKRGIAALLIKNFGFYFLASP